jgi:hypothetical protein
VLQQQLSDDVRFGSNSATCVRFGNSCSSFSDSDISALQRSAALFSYSSLSDNDDGAAPAAVTSVAFDMRPLASQKQLRQRCVHLPQHPLS